MRGFTFSSISRRLTAAGVAFAATMSAACSDAATEPKPVVNVPTAASGAILPLLKTATVNIVDVSGNTIPERAVVKFWTSPNDSVQLIDNAPQDQDPAIGKVKVALVSTAFYKACAWGWTESYMAEKNPAVYANCSQGVINGGQVSFANLHMRRKAKIAFYTQSKNGTLLPGAAVNIAMPNGFPSVTTTDGVQSPGWDYDGAVNGVIVFKSAAGEGVHSWCEVVAPVGYALASPNCGSLTAQFEGNYAIVLKHKAL